MCPSRKAGLDLSWLFDEENPLLPSDTLIDINYAYIHKENGPIE